MSDYFTSDIISSIDCDILYFNMKLQCIADAWVDGNAVLNIFLCVTITEFNLSYESQSIYEVTQKATPVNSAKVYKNVYINSGYFLFLSNEIISS
jgi:hypothetical protein